VVLAVSGFSRCKICTPYDTVDVNGKGEDKVFLMTAVGRGVWRTPWFVK
jgi:hypothetical protein